MTNKDDNMSKPPTTLMLRPMTKQQDEARQCEKARHVTNNDNEDALIQPTTMTTTMTMMTTLCQSLPFFIDFFIPCQGGGCSDDGGSGDSSFGGSCGG